MKFTASQKFFLFLVPSCRTSLCVSAQNSYYIVDLGKKKNQNLRYKARGIFLPKHLEASGEVHTVPCEKVIPYGRKWFIWLHCCKGVKIDRTMLSAQLMALGQILLTLCK